MDASGEASKTVKPVPVRTLATANITTAFAETLRKRQHTTTNSDRTLLLFFFLFFAYATLLGTKMVV